MKEAGKAKTYRSDYPVSYKTNSRLNGIPKDVLDLLKAVNRRTNPSQWSFASQLEYQNYNRDVLGLYAERNTKYVFSDEGIVIYTESEVMLPDNPITSLNTFMHKTEYLGALVIKVGDAVRPFLTTDVMLDTIKELFEVRRLAHHIRKHFTGKLGITLYSDNNYLPPNGVFSYKNESVSKDIPVLELSSTLKSKLPSVSPKRLVLITPIGDVRNSTIIASSPDIAADIIAKYLFADDRYVFFDLLSELWLEPPRSVHYAKEITEILYTLNSNEFINVSNYYRQSLFYDSILEHLVDRAYEAIKDFIPVSYPYAVSSPELEKVMGKYLHMRKKYSDTDKIYELSSGRHVYYEYADLTFEHKLGLL